MNEEEKKIVEKFKRLYLKDFNNEKITNEDRLSYIECALISNLIEKLQKENEELRISNKYTIHLTDEQYNAVIKNAQNDINQKWIQKVKDKIEELKNEKEEYYSQYKIDELNDKIQILQELIEEREEK